MYTTPGLPGKQLKRKSEISRIRYINEHTFVRIIPVRIGVTKLHVWTLLHGMDAQKRRTNKVEWGILHSSSIMRFVVASAAEAELGALFHNCQTGMIFWKTLKDLGHPQPKMPVHCDNATAVGIASNTVKRQLS